MPVKIRCRGCEKVLSAPDKARGRVIQCPQCGTKLKVPAGEIKPRAAKAKSAAPSAMDSAEFMANLDLSALESREERICPYCAAEMEPEQAVCRKCGMNIETGTMDPREAKRRARKGPDPALFYSKAWTDSWQFVKEHRKLALRTGWYMTFLAVLHTGCAFMVGWCDRGPPKFFWFMLSALSFLGICGWFWFLTYRVIEATMTKDEKLLERLDFDMFQVIALGLRLVLWPIVCLGPFVVFLPLAIWFYPLATVHMTQKYTYKAWIGWEMLKVGLRNIGPALYYFVVGFVVSLPVLLVAVPMQFVIGLNGAGNPFLGSNIRGVTSAIATAILKLTGDTQPNPESFSFIIAMIPLNIIAAFLVLTPIFLVAALPAVFMMRVNGLLGYYNSERLGLVNFINPNTPATFWVRVLAHLIDLCLWPFASVLVVKEPMAVLVGWMVNAIILLIWWFVPLLLPLGGLVWYAYMFWMYFAVSESTTTRTTIGKDAFGLIVNDLNDKQLTLKKATIRVLGRFVCNLTLGCGYLLAAVPPQKRGLHDLIAGTRCCWRGDR